MNQAVQFLPSIVSHPVLVEPYVEADGAAQFIHIKPRSLKKMAREGSVPAHPRGDGKRRRWLFLLSELDEWMRSRVHANRDPSRGTRGIQ
jgi:hypothetical protein